MKYTQTLTKMASLVIVGLLIPGAVFGATTFDTALNIPDKPKVEKVLDGTVELSWATVKVGEEEVPAYKIFYGEKLLTGSETTFIEVKGATKGTVTGLTNGKKYYFGVVAVDKDGKESQAFSPQADATPQGATDNLKNASSLAVVKAEAVSATEVRLLFNGDIVLPLEKAEAAFTVSEKENENILIPVIKASTDEMNKKIIILETAPLKDKVNYIVVSGTAITDSQGNYVKSGVTDKAEFVGTLTPVASTMEDAMEDTSTSDSDLADSLLGMVETTTGSTISETETSTEVVPLMPEDVLELMATLKEVAGKALVNLSWKLPTINNPNVVAQMVYKSMDGNLFEKVTQLGPDSTQYELAVNTAGTHYFKVTRKDNLGQESKGALTKVDYLPSSGPIAAVPLLLFGALGAAVEAFRKEKK